jgi:hypothetical protein
MTRRRRWHQGPVDGRTSMNAKISPPHKLVFLIFTS